MKNLQKRQVLIRKLFKVIAKETVGAENLRRVKLLILTKFGRGASYCGTRWKQNGEEYIRIALNLKALEVRIKEGYKLPNYYNTRPKRLNKYIINNRHNALRFVLYHEARHAYQRINNINNDSQYQKEYDADTWAIAHLKTRQPAQTKPDPKVAEYIRLYEAGITTAKIALLCKVKDPRSVRYHLTKAGISLRRRA